MKPKVQSPASDNLPAEQRLSAPKAKPQTNRARTQDNEQTTNKQVVPEATTEREQDVTKKEPEVKPEEESQPEKETVELDESEVAK